MLLQGYAVRAGMLVARGQRLLFMDADGATKVGDLEKLEAELQRISSGICPRPQQHTCAEATVGPWANSGLDWLAGTKAEALGMVVGSRAHLERDAIAQRAWHRNLLMHGFHLLVMLVAGGAVRDTQCGFKARPLSVSHDANSACGHGKGRC